MFKIKFYYAILIDFIMSHIFLGNFLFKIIRLKTRMAKVI